MRHGEVKWVAAMAYVTGLVSGWSLAALLGWCP